MGCTFWDTAEVCSRYALLVSGEEGRDGFADAKVV